MHILPCLPFDPRAFGAWSSEETFAFHHGKHHAGYVNKLNVALEGSPLANSPLEDVIASARASNSAALFNAAAQHFNHDFFWRNVHPDGGEPSGEIKSALEASFGDVTSFQKQFSDAAATLFGSGWTWLVRQSDGTLAIQQTKNAETPVGTGARPLLTLDVWEHAYYIDHRNNRQAFIGGFWRHINWEFVNAQMGSTRATDL